MRSKENILTDLKVQGNLTSYVTEKQLITSNLFLEVLIDIRDLLKCLHDDINDMKIS